MHILVDQDDVIADFEEQFRKEWTKKHPDLIYIPREQRTAFYIVENYPLEYKDLIKEVQNAEGFCRNMPPIEGGIEAIKEMAAMGIEVSICTSPLTSSKYCASEKFEWVDYYLGREWMKKLVITSDKTKVLGDYLIDDRPEIKGIEQPIWEHIIFDQPWNRNVKNSKRIVNWQNWKEVLQL